jgi:hypothetical protein
MILDIIFLSEESNGTHVSADVQFNWPGVPRIGETIDLHRGSHQGKYLVSNVLWYPGTQSNGSAALFVRPLNAPPPKPEPAEDLGRAFIEVSELASRQRQELLNTRSDLRDTETQLQIARDQWEEMRKQRDAILARAQDASLKIAKLERIVEELKELK